MFHGVAVVNHVQENDEKATFYVQAELILSQDVIHAQLELQGVDTSVHATVLSNAKAGRNAFDISGNGVSPLKVGDTIRVTCFEKGEVADHDLGRPNVGTYPIADPQIPFVNCITTPP